jgi:hypothetical protein
MSKPPLQPQDKYVLRMPDGLRDRIKAYAERHGRSMNTEIVRVLEREFPEPLNWEDKIRAAFGDAMPKDEVDVLIKRVLNELENARVLKTMWP